MSLETQQVGTEFAAFLKTIKRGAEEDVSKHLKYVINKIQNSVESPIEDQSETIQDFYQTLADRVSNHAIYRGK